MTKIQSRRVALTQSVAVFLSFDFEGNAIDPNVEIVGISKSTRYCSPIEMNYGRNKIHFTLNQNTLA